MTFDLAQSVSRLAASGRAKEITRAIADQNVARAVAVAVDAQHRAATLFSAGIGGGFPAVSHMAGDRARMASLFGAEPEGLVTKLLAQLAAPAATAEAGGSYPVVAEGRAIDLIALRLPQPSAMAGVLALGADGADQAIVTFEIVARDQVLIRTLPWRLRSLWSGRRTDQAALIIGASPACLAGAALSAAGASGGHRLATALGGSTAPMTSASSVSVPADAGIALVGTFDAAGESRTARLTVRHLSRQEQPLLHLLAGGPFALERLGFEALGIELAVARQIRNVEGGIDLIDLRALPETENRVVAVKFRPRVEGQSKTVLMSALSAPDLRPVLAIGVDEDIDLDDPRDIGWAMASRLNAEFDVAVVRGLPSPTHGGDPVAIAKWLIDATMPPLTQPQRRQVFERALPKNLDTVRLEDFLP